MHDSAVDPHASQPEPWRIPAVAHGAVGLICRGGHIQRPGFKSVTLPILFTAADGAKGLAAALDKIFAAADKAVYGRTGKRVSIDRS